MRGNKNQYGHNFIGLTVKHKKHGKCIIVDKMSSEEYTRLQAQYDPCNLDDHKAIMAVYNSVFTLKNSEGETFKSGRSGFTIPREKGE
jgi:hypothetical protein